MKRRTTLPGLDGLFESFCRRYHTPAGHRRELELLDLLEDSPAIDSFLDELVSKVVFAVVIGDVPGIGEGVRASFLYGLGVGRDLSEGSLRLPKRANTHLK